MATLGDEGQFQSTPANFTAGDDIPLKTGVRWSGFQSTPANFTAGDRRLFGGFQRMVYVSIHARQFHSGRPRASMVVARVPGFQSTPANFTAGDFCGLWLAPRSRTFQSTPANFTAGDRYRSLRSCARCSGFNPRPPISQRATPRSQVLVSKGKNHRIPRTGLDRGASEVLAACDQEQSWHGTGTCTTREPPGPKAVTRGSRRP